AGAFVAQALRQRLGAVDPLVRVQHHVQAVARQALGDGRPQAAAGARDQCTFHVRPPVVDTWSTTAARPSARQPRGDSMRKLYITFEPTAAMRSALTRSGASWASSSRWCNRTPRTLAR